MLATATAAETAIETKKARVTAVKYKVIIGAPVGLRRWDE
jgi:hypothetical protein